MIYTIRISADTGEEIEIHVKGSFALGQRVFSLLHSFSYDNNYEFREVGE